MDFVLDPPRAAGPVRLGMTPEEALAAVAPWGTPEVAPPGGRPPEKIFTACREIGVSIFLEDSGGVVTAVELWWPGEGRRTDVRVLLDGDDVFTTPAETSSARRESAAGPSTARNPSTPSFLASRWASPARPPRRYPAPPGPARPCHLGPRGRRALLRLPRGGRHLKGTAVNGCERLSNGPEGAG